MVLPVPSPQKHPRTGVYYFRQRVPTDLRAAFGKAEVSWSLGTKDPQEARRLHAEATRKQALVWQALRAKPEPLTQKDVAGLAGAYYRELVSTHEASPGDPREWDATGSTVIEAAENPRLAEKMHGEEADRLLREAGLTADAESRERLIEAMNSAFLQASQVLERMAAGDYRPDPHAGRFPEKPAVRTSAVPQDKPTLTSLFAL